MSSESEVQQHIQIQARHFNCTLMRNNNGACKDATGRLIRFGLGHVSPNQPSKSSDLIGITSIVITPDMVGKTVGIFTAIEVKAPDWKPTKKLDEHEIKQNNYLLWVKSLGGIASFANSVDNLNEIFRR